MTRYRLIPTVDWAALAGQRFELEVSPNYVILKPLKAGAPAADYPAGRQGTAEQWAARTGVRGGGASTKRG